jgi:predicted phosphoadenosine phosphosulfate sulfurtransferase
MHFGSAGGMMLTCPSMRLCTPYGQRDAHSPQLMQVLALLTWKRLIRFSSCGGTWLKSSSGVDSKKLVAI